MKPSYTPDNTRSSMAVILLLAAGVSIVAVLLGLSEKPDVTSIGVAVTPEEAAVLLADAPAPAVTADDGEELADPAFSVPAAEPTTAAAATADGTGSSATGAADTGAAGTVLTDETGAVITDESGQPIPADEATDAEAAAIPAVTAIPVPEPTATPEVAAAVVPTVPAEDATDDLDSLETTPRITAGTVSGEFFTRVFEDEGATVARNEVTLIFSEDGTGTFSGNLDMALLDETRVTLSMSGPFEWSALESPQVVAELAGSYVSDSLTDTNDVAATDAELTITSLGSGSGALCATDVSCFGFRFPAQTGF